MNEAFFLQFQRRLPLIYIVLVSILFFTLRLFHLPQTLEFFGDLGRDMYVVQTMVYEIKPTLLGPSTSVLPINQSAWYFYFFLPVFLLSNQSAYTTVITTLALFVLAFFMGFFLLKSHHSLRTQLLMVATLISLHPQLIAQSRSPWNPTFSVPFICICCVSFVLLQKRDNIAYVGIFCLAAASAIGMSFSVTPAISILCVLVASKLNNRKKNLLFFGLLILSLVIAFAPNILFELRHDFFLTKRLFLTPVLPRTQQQFISEKIQDLFSFLLGISELPFLWIGLSILIFIYAYVLFFKKTTDAHEIESRKSNHLFALVAVVNTLVLLIVPIGIEPHYIFGSLIPLFFSLSFLPKKHFFLILLFAILVWGRPMQSNQFLTPARRTIEELEACANRTCEKPLPPFLVATQAWHSYHYAPEYLFLFRKHGCDVADITTDPNFSDTMAIIADQASYEHTRTSFNELTLFGKAELSQSLQCADNIMIHFLNRSPEQTTIPNSASVTIN